MSGISSEMSSMSSEMSTMSTYTKIPAKQSKIDSKYFELGECKKKYLLTKKLIAQIITYEGSVFGGAVRDIVLHDHHATKFYETYDPTSYQDPTIGPEYSERFLVPKDIDFIIKVDKVKGFMERLYQLGCFINIKKTRDMSYFMEIEPFQYELRKMTVLLNGHIIHLDMIVCFDEFSFPPMHDFDVNQLVQNYNGISKKSELNLDYLLNQVKNKVATCSSSIHPYRIEKMREKGWTILIQYHTFVFQNRINPQKEHCIICMDDLEMGALEAKETGCDCNYSYCKKCLDHSLQLNCLLCKKDVNKDYRFIDVNVFKKYGILS